MPSDANWRVVRRTLADGTVREYRYPRKPESRPELYRSDTIGALIVAYRQSPEWHGLRASTQKNYNIYLRHLENFRAVSVVGMKRRELLDIRDAIAASSGNGAANVFIRVSTTLFAWARDREWVEHSPLHRVKALPGGHLAAWTAQEADTATKLLPSYLGRVVTLARYTGQRRGDLIAMTWHAYDGASIRVKQEKTGAPLLIPVHPVLAAALDSWKRTTASTHILTSQVGIPWTANHLTHTMSAELAKIGLRPHLNVHGLRKLAAASLADAGCTAHEIAAVTGHRSLAMVQLYTASADQQRLAKAAILRLGNAPKNARKTSPK